MTTKDFEKGCRSPQISRMKRGQTNRPENFSLKTKSPKGNRAVGTGTGAKGAIAPSIFLAHTSKLVQSEWGWVDYAPLRIFRPSYGTVIHFMEKFLPNN